MRRNSHAACVHLLTNLRGGSLPPFFRLAALAPFPVPAPPPGIRTPRGCYCKHSGARHSSRPPSRVIRYLFAYLHPAPGMDTRRLSLRGYLKRSGHPSPPLPLRNNLKSRTRDSTTNQCACSIIIIFLVSLLENLCENRKTNKKIEKNFFEIVIHNKLPAKRSRRKNIAIKRSVSESKRDLYERVRKQRCELQFRN